MNSDSFSFEVFHAMIDEYRSTTETRNSKRLLFQLVCGATAYIQC